MKKLLILPIALLLTFVMIQCKDKDEDPPAPSNGPTNKGTGTTTIDGTTTSLLTTCTVDQGNFGMIGYTSGTYPLVSIVFEGAKPTQNGVYTISLSGGSTNVTASLSTTSSDVYFASSGDVTVTVSGNSITASYANVTFTHSTTPADTKVLSTSLTCN